MSLFRKKSPTPEEQAFQAAISEQFDRKDDVTDDDEGEQQDAVAPAAEETDDGAGPRLDFGALKVPAVEGMQVRAELDDDQNVVGVAVMVDESVLQLQAFAAPRSESLWDEVRQEIAEGIRGGQGRAREVEGPFGREIQAEVVVSEGGEASDRQPVRFIGRDGERWFLRGVVTGPGASDTSRAEGVEAIFRDVRVERGTHAAPPRDPLPLALPDDAALVPDEGGVDDPTEA
jgi:hypothetical protein